MSATDPRQDRAVLAAAILATVMGILEISVVNIALPVIQRDLGASWTTAQWVMEAYILMLAALILAGGAIADRYGRRFWFGFGIAVFAVGSLACGLASDGVWLVASRFLQGFGAAFMVPGSLGLIAAHFPPERRGRAVGWWSASTAAAVAGGPALAGWVVQAASWRLLFLIAVPLAAAALVVLWRGVPESKAAHGRRLDWLGAALITVTLGCLTAGLLEAGRPANRAGPVWPLLGAALVFGLVFVASQLARRDPLLPPSLFRGRAFVGVNLATMVLYAGLQAATFFLPFQLMQVHGWAPVGAGAAMLPFVIVIGCLSPVSGRLTDRLGALPLLVVGTVVASVGFFLLSRLAHDDATVGVIGAMVTLGFGMGLVVTPISTAALNAAGGDAAGLASAVNNTAARIGGLLSIALLGLWAATMFEARLEAGLPALALTPTAVDEVRIAAEQLAALSPPASLDAEQAAAVRALAGVAFAGAFQRIMWASAGLALLSGLVLALTVRREQR